jgi:hypothetical protein
MVSVSITELLTAIGIFAVLGPNKSCTEYIMLEVRRSSVLQFLNSCYQLQQDFLILEMVISTACSVY